MAAITFPKKEAIFEKFPCPKEEFHQKFTYVTLEKQISYGYFAINDDNISNYLFLSEGKVFTAGRSENNELTPILVRDFFNFYSQINNPQLSFYTTDEILLYCLTVVFQHTPTIQATTDIVDAEEVLAKLEEKKGDAVLSVEEEDKISLILCRDGKPTDLYFVEPSEALGEESIMDKLLVFVYSKAHKKPLEINLYQDIIIKPASDSGFPNLEIEGDILSYYTKPRPEIILKVGEDILGRYIIKSEALSIGRISSNDVVINNLSVSRRHALVKEEDSKFFVEDLNSVNGTFVNGVRITKKQLYDGDEIYIGNHKLIFNAPEAKAVKEGESLTMEKKTVLIDTTAFQKYQEAIETKTDSPKLLMPGKKPLYLTKDIFIIGSGQDADLKLEGMFVGDIHAKIVKEKVGSYSLQHIYPKGLTRVNGSKIDKHMLKDGDEIQISKYRLIFNK